MGFFIMTDTRIQEAQKWIEEITGQPFQGDFQEHLKSGVVLCELLNKVNPGTISKINRNRMPFVQMENVNAYINACKGLGVPDQYNFVTIDLFEGKNLVQVAQNIITLKRELGYGFEKQAPAQIQDYGNASSAPVSQDLPVSEQPTEFNDGTKTGTAYRPGQGQVHEERLAKECEACGRVISSGFVNACGTSWHPNCFTCKKCGTKLARAKYYEHNNVHYCERCILIVNPKTTVKSTTRDMGFKFAN